MKKILCLIDNLGSGGAQRQMVNLAVMLRNSGYIIEFVTYNENSFFKYILDEADISVHCLNASNPIKRIKKVVCCLRHSDADVVISFLETPGFLACLAKNKKTKWKLITSELSAMESTFQGARQKIYNWFERRSDIKVCNSHNARKLWEKNYPQYTDKLCVIYNPVIIPEVHTTNHRKNDGKMHMVVAASYQELKNPLGVIEALLLLESEVRAKLKIDWYGRPEVTVGDTRIYDEARRKIAEYDLQSVIELHKDTNQIYPIMQNADVVGLFSTVEGLPNAICEAMMLEKPIVMSRVSDYHVLTDGNGILCNTDAKSIAEALSEVVALSKEQLEDMARISGEKAEQLFSQDVILRQWVRVIEQ